MLDASSRIVKRKARPGLTSCALAFQPMKPVKLYRRDNLARLAEKAGGQAAIASRIGKDRNQVYQWLLPADNPHSRNLGDSSARLIEEAFKLPAGWLDRPSDSTAVPDATLARYAVVEADPEQAMEVEFMDVMGSCGGGVLNLGAERRAPLMKEPQWFRRYGVKPADALAVWADGDSMADFIVDGDIVIFDRSKTLPRSGKIFLLEHPDGLRIKRLRQQFDRSWIMESNNPDKRRYPDELVTAEQAEHLRVIGQFVYRQGG